MKTAARVRGFRSDRRWWAVVAGVLAVTAVVGVVASSPAARPASPSCAASSTAAPSTVTPIHHLFVLIKENHAFENYFGSKPGVLGYPPNGSLPVAFNSSTVVHPFPLTGYRTPDFPHTESADRADLNGGRNNGFVAEANASGAPDPQDAAGYYTVRQLYDYFEYADAYGLGDQFFTGVLGPTEPNRVFDITGYAGSWDADAPPPANVTAQPTVLGQLEDAGIPWLYSYQGSETGLVPLLFPAITSDPCALARITPVSSLPAQLSSPTPPSVVFIDPSPSQRYSEHPPENVTVGMEWSTAVINAIETSPVANSSAILLFYDENGGYWDPIPPPLTSTGSDGFRVPFVVISPWTPPGTVCSAPLDPAAVLRFIDVNWRLPFLNARVADAPSLGCFFNFTQPPRPPIVLPTPIGLTSSSAAASVARPPAGVDLGRGSTPALASVSGGTSAALTERRSAWIGRLRRPPTRVGSPRRVGRSGRPR